MGFVNLKPGKLSILEDHLEIRHMKKKTRWWQESQKTEHYCDNCGNSAKNFIQYFVGFLIQNKAKNVNIIKIVLQSGNKKYN